jgi:hypothetical protein
MNIFVHRNGQQLGPFSESDIQAQLVSGAISPVDLVWWEGQAGWVPLSQTPYAAVSTPPVPPTAVGIPPSTPTPVLAAEQRTSGAAIGSLVCGLAGLLFALLGIVAVILGHKSRAEIKRDPSLKGEGMALAGLILGYCEIALTALSVVAIIALIALGSQVKSVFSTINSESQMHQFTPDTNSPADNSTPATNGPDTNSPTTNAAPANP